MDSFYRWTLAKYNLIINTTKKKLSEVVANKNILYRAITRLNTDTADVSERLSTNSKKIEWRSIEA